MEFLHKFKMWCKLPRADDVVISHIVHYNASSPIQLEENVIKIILNNIEESSDVVRVERRHLKRLEFLSTVLVLLKTTLKSSVWNFFYLSFFHCFFFILYIARRRQNFVPNKIYDRVLWGASEKIFFMNLHLIKKNYMFALKHLIHPFEQHLRC